MGVMAYALLQNVIWLPVHDNVLKPVTGYFSSAKPARSEQNTSLANCPDDYSPRSEQPLRDSERSVLNWRRVRGWGF